MHPSHQLPWPLWQQLITIESSESFRRKRELCPRYFTEAVIILWGGIRDLFIGITGLTYTDLSATQGILTFIHQITDCWLIPPVAAAAAGGRALAGSRTAGWGLGTFSRAGSNSFPPSHPQFLWAPAALSKKFRCHNQGTWTVASVFPLKKNPTLNW